MTKELMTEETVKRGDTNVRKQTKKKQLKVK
jgi:hypothetical protein